MSTTNPLLNIPPKTPYNARNITNPFLNPPPQAPYNARNITNPFLTPPPKAPYNARNITNLGFGYAIAISLGFLVLLSILLLTSYICCRAATSRRRRLHQNNDNGVYLPRIIFVAEDDEDNQNGVVGLDQTIINAYPKFIYSKKFGNNIETVCPICLCEYKESEMLRMLPECNHYFHVMCVDAWLKLNASCPVCRNSPLPTPLSTPLSEVVPLSQYSDGRRRL